MATESIRYGYIPAGPSWPRECVGEYSLSIRESLVFYTEWTVDMNVCLTIDYGASLVGSCVEVCPPVIG